MTFASGPTLAELAVRLDNGQVTSRALVEECLDRIDDPSGEGARAFIEVNRAQSIAVADSIDALRKAGIAASQFAGIPISVKDLFDLQGQITRAGSTVLAGREPAACDAEVVRRLKQVGFVVIGRTNMSEFAFSGVGLNPHYGTPLSVWDRSVGRIPGGSSSGAAISVADGMAHAAVGTDTGGSCRIPAAFNGIVGFKPTARRVSRNGVIPLSQTLDSVGPLARSVRCCAILDAIMAGQSPPVLAPRGIKGFRILVPNNYVTDDMDAAVDRAFNEAIGLLCDAGAYVDEGRFTELDDIPAINRSGGFAAAESYAWHEDMLSRKEHDYDPRVAVRIKRGKEQSAIDYIRLVEARFDFIDRVEKRLAPYDFVAFPTVPVSPPRLLDLESDEAYSRINLLCLRNSSIVNLWDGCAVSVPISAPGDVPIGMTLAACRGRDELLLAAAHDFEQILRKTRSDWW